MAPKQQLDKEAWQWAEKTDPNEISIENVHTAYRINLRPCKPNSCRKNCKGNPKCLIGLGERAWLGEIDDRYWHDIGDSNLEARQPGALVGLKNLGATCYVNTFLQVWFHNNNFCEAILRWNQDGEYQEPKSDSQEDSNSHPLMPTSICGHLQLIFAHLTFTARRYVDPTSFIKCLQLDAGQQQDAQEFSKLFITLLEDQLLHHPDPSISSLIQRQFRGTYHYSTRCSGCQTTKQTPSSFYELDLNIKGNKNLHECIEEFLKEESLDGDNQYMCSQCGDKRDATRAIQLSGLPAVLNMQLLRFVFDRKTGHKKKLNSYIQFPEMLDMSSYLNLPDGSCMYELQAVLIHRGPSAYSGHYIAHIWHSNSQSWHKFNDEVVEKMAGRKLQLATEDEIDGKGTGKKPKVCKGVHVSRNAYMLVYSQVKPGGEATVPGAKSEPQLSDMSSEVRRCIEHDEQQFSDWMKEMNQMKEENIRRGRERHNEVRHTCGLLSSASQSNEYEWMKSAWLSKWLACDHSHQVPPIDNTSLLCSHDKLDPDKVQDAKYVPTEAADLIYSKYCGGPRLKGEGLFCETCVRSRCRDIRAKTLLAEDSKLITALLKNQLASSQNEEMFWVGKSSLRSWRRLAASKFEGKETNGSVTHDALNGSESKSGCESSRQVRKGLNPTETDSEELAAADVEFNHDLLCQHGNLCTNEAWRRLVPSNIWHRLKTYFPKAPEFPLPRTASCSLCKAIEEEENAESKARLETATQLKKQLLDLYVDRNRPSPAKVDSPLFIISTAFLQCWKDFIRDPLRNDPPQVIDNSSLMCEHGGFLYDIDCLTYESHSERFHFVVGREWETLTKQCAPSNTIHLSQQESQSNVSLKVSPDVCEACSSARKRHDYMSQFNYTNALIFIRKLTKNENTFTSDKFDVTCSGETLLHNGNSDPEYVQCGEKRKKCDEPESSVEKYLRLDMANMRRSGRHRRIRGEKEIQINSSNTLRELKIKVMGLFSVPPFDQHLLYNGKELKGDTCSLASLHILPGSVIYLQADEPVLDPSYLDEVGQGQSIEEGFKGTGLLGN